MPAPAIELTLIKGKAEKEVYTFDQDRILIGRLREVTDEHGRLRRYNDLAFTEDDKESRSVSREQARVERRDEEVWLVDGERWWNPDIPRRPFHCRQQPGPARNPPAAGRPHLAGPCCGSLRATGRRPRHGSGALRAAHPKG